jgi:hypothetical protein
MSCLEFAVRGDLTELKWARKKECPLGGGWHLFGSGAPGRHRHVDVAALWDENTCVEAARIGNLEILKWAHTSGCPWNENTCEALARRGGRDDLTLLQWARNNGCPWNSRVWENGCPWDADVCVEAARMDHLPILVWAREDGCPWDSRVCMCAAESRATNVLAWALVNGGEPG